MVGPAAEDRQPKDQVGPAKRCGECHRTADAVAHHVRRPAYHPLQELNQILAQGAVGVRPFHVGRMAVTSQVDGVDVEVLRQSVDVRVEPSGVDRPAVQQHDGLPLSPFVVPGSDTRKLGIGPHTDNLCVL